MPRRTALQLIYEGHEATGIGVIESFRYSDEASESSDEISFILDNIDNRWQNGWAPKLNDKLKATIIQYGDVDPERRFDCGSFIVDDFGISATPLTCEINALSTPVNEGFKSQLKSKIWKEVTVKQIASEIAAAAGLSLVFDAEDTPAIKEKEQSSSTDVSFLSGICSEYGLQMKVYANKVVIYDDAVYEAKPPVGKITPWDLVSWNYKTSIVGTYTGANLSYTDPKENKTISVSVGTPERLLYLNESVTDPADAEKKALAKVNSANRGLVTMNLEMLNPVFYAATSVVALEDFGQIIDGNFFITKVEHNITSQGYVVNLELRKIIKRIEKPAAPVPAEADGAGAAGGARQYTLKAGDVLWNVAKKFYGSGAQYTKIYDANAQKIEEVARQHGKKSSDHGHWVWPGTVLNIPD